MNCSIEYRRLMTAITGARRTQLATVCDVNTRERCEFVQVVAAASPDVENQP